ncbi:MAG TPA: hypothetical protein VGG24_18845 [Paraburkholderia sp.]
MATHEPSPSPPPRPPLAQRLHAWTGILVVPVIWVLHLLVSVTLVGAACAGGVQQRNALSWPVVETLLRASSALGFIVALACTVLAWRAWRRAAQAGGAAPDDYGKHRFLALCGAMTSAGFTIAFVFTASVLIAAAPAQLCEPFR